MSTEEKRPRRATSLISTAIVVAVTALGAAMRVFNARTIHGYGRVSDFPNTVTAVEWVAREHRMMDAGGALHNGYHGPLWYALAARVLTWSDRLHVAGWERYFLPALVMSVLAWLVRQFLLDAGIREALPGREMTRVTATALHAVLPVSAYQDGVFYNESLHATLFAAAAFFLLRIERAGPARMRASDAWWFGAFSGLALITKASAVALPAIAIVLVFMWIVRARWRWPLVVRDVTRPMLLATLGWILGGGWWCARNLAEYEFALPHQYDIRRAAVITAHRAVGDPLLEHRSLGWWLPSTFEYLETPVATWTRKNFWQQIIAGTWVDDINHGFCRMSGNAFLRVSSSWVTDRCFAVEKQLVLIGTALTLVAVVACLALGWLALRSRGHRGSLVIPGLCALTMLMLAVFAAMYPFDHHPVVKATYALHIAPLLCACVGLAMLEPAPGASRPPSARTSTQRARQFAVWTLRLIVASLVLGVGVLVSKELWAA